MNKLIISIILAFGISSTVFAQQQASYALPTDPNARDLVILTDWFEGRFDNEEQLWFEQGSRSATPEEERHERLHTMHRRLDLADMGDHVFYVEEYKDNDPESVVRQRIVIFSSEEKTKGIRMQQGFFKNTEKAKGAYVDPDKLSKLTAKDVFFMDECDVYWHRKADQYEGQMKPKACVFGKDEKRRYSVHNLILSEDKYWRVDLTRLVADDSIHVGHPEDSPHQMRRAKMFICDVSVRRADKSVDKYEDIRVHSQGGTFKIDRGDGKSEVTVRMRDKQYPYYDTRPDFIFLAVREKGAQRSLAYGIHDTDSRRLGMNFDNIGIHCYREGYHFREEINQL